MMFLFFQLENASMLFNICVLHPDVQVEEKEPNKDKGSTEELEFLLVKLVNQMLCEAKVRDYPRIAAFVKRMLSLCLHQDTSTQMGILAIANRSAQEHAFKLIYFV